MQFFCPGADTINNYYSANVTINGGNDTFIYDVGDDKSKNSVAFKVGTGSVTLRDFGTTTLFHVNDTTYRLSGGKLRAK